MSKGTYIRAFIRDLAKSLHTIGMMTSLTRTKQGNFKIEDSYSLEEIEMGKYTFVPLEEVLKEYKTIEVNEEEKEKIQNGSLRFKNTQEEVVVFTYQNTPLALYKSYEKNPNYLKPWKMF